MLVGSWLLGFARGCVFMLSVLSRQTPKADLGSKLGMDLKRTMLLRLARRDPNLHPDDPARREAIYDKYKVGAQPAASALGSAAVFTGGLD